jgi:hypothetical protein
VSRHCHITRLPVEQCDCGACDGPDDTPPAAVTATEFHEEDEDPAVIFAKFDRGPRTVTRRPTADGDSAAPKRGKRRSRRKHQS